MRYLFSLVLFIYSIFSVAQETYKNIRLDRKTLPSYIIANLNDTIGIAFTISDVQKIDKSLEVLEYLENRSSKIDTTLYYYISLVGDLELKIDLQKTKIENISSQMVISTGMIEDLKSQISTLKESEKKSDEIISNKDKIITTQKDEIKKQKFLKSLFLTIGGAVIITLTVLSASGS